MITELQLMLIFLVFVFAYQKLIFLRISAQLFSEYPSRSKVFLACECMALIGAVLSASLQIKLILIFFAYLFDELFWNLNRRITLDHRMNSTESKQSFLVLYAINKCWQISLICGLLGSFIALTGINYWLHGDVDMGLTVDTETFYIIKHIIFWLGNIMLESGFYGGIACNVFYRGIYGDVCRFSLREVLSRESFLLLIIGIGLTTCIKYSNTECFIAQSLVMGILLLVLLINCLIKLIKRKTLQDWIQVWFWYNILVSGIIIFIIKYEDAREQNIYYLPFSDISVSIRFLPLVLSAFYLMQYIGLDLLLSLLGDDVSDDRENKLTNELDGLYTIHPIQAMLIHGLVLHLSCCPFFIGFIFTVGLIIISITLSSAALVINLNLFYLLLSSCSLLSGIILIIATTMLYIRCHTFIWRMIYGFPRKSKNKLYNIRLNFTSIIFLISSFGFLLVVLYKLVPVVE